LTAELPDGESYVMLSGGEESILPGAMAEGHTPAVHTPLSVHPVDDKAYVFGALREGKICPPEDPMIETVMIRGNPELNAERCSAKARRYEILSAFLFALAVVPNFFLVFLILRYLIR